MLIFMETMNRRNSDTNENDGESLVKIKNFLLLISMLADICNEKVRMTRAKWKNLRKLIMG